jgi:signal peptidase II
VLGGALGNLTDRLVRGPELSGEVVDFIDFQVWPVFNIADSCIVIGAALLLLTGARVSRTETEPTA